MPSAPAVLCLQQVTKQFERSSVPAVNGATLALQQGELLALLGPSGCGKTTLLRLVAGFEKPQVGLIDLAGKQVCSGCKWVTPEQRSVGIVFQDYALFPHLSVLDNVAFGLKQQARQGEIAKPQVRKLAHEAIQLVGLKGFEQRYPHELSGGQQQRVALARALAPRPPLILLDEPFSNLDVQVRLYLRQEVRNILRQIGASGIFVTHDQEEALAIADRVAVMRQGHIEQIDTPEAIYQQPASRFVAEFVTQANFIPARRQGAGWQTEIGYFEPSAMSRWQNAAANERAIAAELMIRQEDLGLESDPTGELVVRDRQFLGREYKYSILTPNARLLYARTSTHQRFSVGERIRAAISPSTLRLFPVSAADPGLPKQPPADAPMPTATAQFSAAFRP